MKTSSKKFKLSCLNLALISCGGLISSLAYADSQEFFTTQVYKYINDPACGGDRQAISQNDMLAELHQSNISALCVASGNDGLAHTESCGSNTGNLNSFTINSKQIQDAINLGYFPLSDFSEPSLGECIEARHATIYKYTGAQQCGPNTGESIAAMQETLAESGIVASCAKEQYDLLMRPSVCGAGTGKFNAFQISRTQLNDAQDLGFSAYDPNNIDTIGLISMDCDLPEPDIDTDGDSIIDSQDNCPVIANKGQWDKDGDGIGNACDEDIDGDGYSNVAEEIAKSLVWDAKSVPPLPNDWDVDGILNDVDNCISVYNPGQWDKDGDRIGNECDWDIDNDTYSNRFEVKLGSQTYNASDTPVGHDDWDGDGIANEQDNCPLIKGQAQWDNDQDGQGNKCDDDVDGDGFSNKLEAHYGSLVWDATSTPLTTMSSDIDEDGIENNNDNCPNIANAQQDDLDSDGRGDACDDDMDGDGFSNELELESNTDPLNSNSTPIDRLLKHDWSLVHFISNSDNHGYDILPKTSYSIAFDVESKGVSGMFDCNAYTSAFRLSDANSLVIEPIQVDTAVCELGGTGSGDYNHQNDVISDVLNHGSDFTFDAGNLVLTSDFYTLIFEPAASNEDYQKLINRDWYLQSYGSKDMYGGLELTHYQDGAELSLRFDDENKIVSGFGGCNRFSGPYAWEDSQFIIDGVSSTKIACKDLDIEGITFDVLSSIESYKVAGDELRLESSSGDVLIYSEIKPTLVLTNQALLQNKKWYVEEYWYQESDGEINSYFIAPDSNPDLEFGLDGRASGRIDCNSASGFYDSSEQTIEIKPLATTRKSCPHFLPQLYTAQATRLYALLERIDSYNVSEDSLRISNKNGESILFTNKAPRLDDEAVLVNSQWAFLYSSYQNDDIVFETPASFNIIEMSSKTWADDHKGATHRFELLLDGEFISGALLFNGHQLIFPTGFNISSTNSSDPSELASKLVQGLTTNAFYLMKHVDDDYGNDVAFLSILVEGGFVFELRTKPTM